EHLLSERSSWCGRGAGARPSPPRRGRQYASPRLDAPAAPRGDAPEPRIGIDGDRLGDELEERQVGVRVGVERRVREREAELEREPLRALHLAVPDAERLDEAPREAPAVVHLELARHEVRDAEATPERPSGVGR